MGRVGFLAAAAVIAVAAMGAPAAKAAPGSQITRPDWAQKPSGDDMERFYPERARTENVSGRATITCNVTAQGLLDQCAAEREEPIGYGFGAAAISLSDSFRMKPKTVDGVPVGGGTITIPIIFQVPSAPMLGDFAIVLTRLDAAGPAVPIAKSAGLVINCPDEAGECVGHYLDWLVRPSDRQADEILALAGSSGLTGAKCLIATDGLLEGCEYSGDISPGSLAGAKAAVKLFKAPQSTMDGVPTALTTVLIPLMWPDLAGERAKRGGTRR